MVQNEVLYKDSVDLTRPSYEVHYDLVVSLESALMTFSLEIDGQQMGKVEAKF